MMLSLKSIINTFVSTLLPKELYMLAINIMSRSHIYLSPVALETPSSYDKQCWRQKRQVESKHQCHKTMHYQQQHSMRCSSKALTIKMCRASHRSRFMNMDTLKCSSSQHLIPLVALAAFSGCQMLPAGIPSAAASVPASCCRNAFIVGIRSVVVHLAAAAASVVCRYRYISCPNCNHITSHI